jgi:hypothetical protein
LLLLRGRLPRNWLPRNWLPRNWLPRFRGSLGLNRHHLSIIRINRLYFRLDGVLLLPLSRQLEATILLLPLSRQLEATILLLDGVLLPEGPPLLLVGIDDPAISVDGAALAHAPATDSGASTRAFSSSP